MAKKTNEVVEDEGRKPRPDREFPDQPVRLTNMGTKENPCVQFHFQGGLNGSTNRISEIQALTAILEKNGTGIKHWDPQGKNAGDNKKRKKQK